MSTRAVIIADAHSKNRPTQKLTLDLGGGDPRYGYVWINDECHVVTLNDRTGKVKIRKQR